MHEIQRQRTQELLQSKGLDYALFTTLDSVKWLTGFAPPLEHLGQPHVFAGGPSLVWYEAGQYTLLVLSNYEGLCAPLKADNLDVVTYSVYDIQAPMQPIEQIVNAFRGIVSSPGSAVVGIELRSATAALLQTLGDASTTPIDDWLVPLRMIKTDEELKKLRHNFALTDYGHEIVLQTLQAGKREIDVWMDIHSAINRRLGYLVPLGNDCVSSSRQENIGGWPGDIVSVPLTTVTGVIAVAVISSESQRHVSRKCLGLCWMRSIMVSRCSSRVQLPVISTQSCVGLLRKRAIRCIRITAATVLVSPVTKRRVLFPITMKSSSRGWSSCWSPGFICRGRSVCAWKTLH
jgi:hypothetical protein